jgi:hypothetical protein
MNTLLDAFSYSLPKYNNHSRTNSSLAFNIWQRRKNNKRIINLDRRDKKANPASGTKRSENKQIFRQSVFSAGQKN